jgi:hypothetical protein
VYDDRRNHVISAGFDESTGLALSVIRGSTAMVYPRIQGAGLPDADLDEPNGGMAWVPARKPPTAASDVRQLDNLLANENQL